MCLFLQWIDVEAYLVRLVEVDEKGEEGWMRIRVDRQ